MICEHYLLLNAPRMQSSSTDKFISKVNFAMSHMILNGVIIRGDFKLFHGQVSVLVNYIFDLIWIFIYMFRLQNLSSYRKVLFIFLFACILEILFEILHDGFSFIFFFIEYDAEIILRRKSRPFLLISLLWN